MLGKPHRNNVDIYYAHLEVRRRLDVLFDVVLYLVSYIGTAYLAVYLDINVRVDNVAVNAAPHAPAAHGFHAAYLLRRQTNYRQ